MNATDVHTLFQQGQLDAAERAAHDRLRQEPRDMECINVLALIALRRGQLDQAKALLDSSLSIAPTHALTRHYLGRVHDAAGRADAAVAAHGAAIRPASQMSVI